MDVTRSGEQISAQIAKMGVIEGLDKGNFTLQSGQNFQIKNDGVQPVSLQVQLAGMEEGRKETRQGIRKLAASRVGPHRICGG